MTHITIPDPVSFIITTLESYGYEAYAVGGCIRDALLGFRPADWDVCTSALPAQTKACFNAFQTIDTGLRHGTITLVLDGRPYEITTFRIDGVYSDNRHPDSAEFTADIYADLARRDFTINALAYNPNAGLIDRYGGVSDLQSGVIRCVGEPDKRLNEDALRIIRALRFASTLGYVIDDATSRSIIKNTKLLNNIALERISSELVKLIVGDDVYRVMDEYKPVFVEIIPELALTIGFEQNNPRHIYDVYRHMIRSVANAPKDHIVRLTMLLHDIGKPVCYTEEDGCGHFHGHQQLSSEIANDILSRMKFDRYTISLVTKLIRYHDIELQPERTHVKRQLNRFGENVLRLLMQVKEADTRAKSVATQERWLPKLNEALVIMDDIVNERQCYSLDSLAINGDDIIKLGIPEGEPIGVLLYKALDMVIDELIPNEKQALINHLEALVK